MLRYFKNGKKNVRVKYMMHMIIFQFIMIGLDNNNILFFGIRLITNTQKFSQKKLKVDKNAQIINFTDLL